MERPSQAREKSWKEKAQAGRRKRGKQEPSTVWEGREGERVLSKWSRSSDLAWRDYSQHRGKETPPSQDARHRHQGEAYLGKLRRAMSKG